MEQKLTTNRSIYQLKEFLGEGASAQVYKAIRNNQGINLNQTVAVKILKSKKLVLGQEISFDEISKIDSKYCAKYLSIECLGGHLSIVMDYIEGLNLDQILQQECLSKSEYFEIYRQLRKAMKDLEYLNIVHGDISPGNIMITKNGELKLIDIAFDCFIGKNNSGTKPFTAPETLKKLIKNHKSDLFSCGNLLGFLLGKSQFLASENLELVESIAQLTKNKPDDRSFRQLRCFRRKNELGAKVRRIMQQQLKSKNTSLIQSVEKKTRHSLNRVVQGLFLIMTSSILSASTLHTKNEYTKMGSISIRSTAWRQVKIDDGNWKYTPIENRRLKKGQHEIFWIEKGVFKKRILTISPAKNIVLQDDFFTGK